MQHHSLFLEELLMLPICLVCFSPFKVVQQLNALPIRVFGIAKAVPTVSMRYILTTFKIIPLYHYTESAVELHSLKEFHFRESFSNCNHFLQSLCALHRGTFAVIAW
jgi:hypothetical protein